MRKKKVKRRIKKKNVAILLLVIACIITNPKETIKSILLKEESVSANSNVIETENIDNQIENTVKEEKPKKTHFKVAIDASYGGQDGGSKGYNGIIQKDVNLDIALKVKDILDRESDVDVILTRKDDSTVSMSERVEIVNNSGADFVVSIMQNTEGSGEVTGIESYVLPPENEKRNATLGYTLQKAMNMYVDTKDRGVLSRNMDILLKSDVPGAVVNTGFISNKDEGTKLSSEEYQLVIADGIAQGILLYIDKHLKE